MTVLEATGDLPPAAAVAAAVAALHDGLVVGVPTDTVYGLATDPSVPGATEALFALKGRPKTVELPVLVADADQMLQLVAAIPRGARRLMEHYWPGPLTIVLSRRPGLGWDLGGDGTTVGIRCPAHPVPLALCRAVGPLATTSANRHGDPPVTIAADVAGALPGVTIVLDGGVCASQPSTVVDCTAAVPRLRRPGAVPAEDLKAVIGALGS